MLSARVPPRYDVFLSYRGRDREVVEQIARRLEREGFVPWLDVWSLTAGVLWHGELAAGLEASTACAVFVGPGDVGAWELEEVAVALDRAAREPGFRVFPVLLEGVGEPFDPNALPQFLRTRTWVDLRGGCDDERVIAQLVCAVRGVPFGSGQRDASTAVEVVPYRGLRVFEERDAALFCGRDGEVQRLVEKLKAARFVAVVGPSGSGKSSLVRAGLLPALRATSTAAAGAAGVLVLRPGAQPLTALAAQLAALGSGASMQATLAGLEDDQRSLHLCVELALADAPSQRRVVLVVDQLEELFTLCGDERQRERFVALMLYAATVHGGRTLVVVTMRGDFYERCAAYPDLAQLIATQQLLVGAMGAQSLRQAIEQPARIAGLRLQPGVVDTILADVGAEPGALPLLEHALLEVWERRSAGTLTLDAYRQAGGVRGALAQRADTIYDALTIEQQQVTRRLLLRLTAPGEGTEDTRRRARRDELTGLDHDDGSIDVVLERLIDARLLTASRDDSAHDVIDVSHEALIRGWPRLRAWIDADRAGLLTHCRLTDAAADWEALKRDPDALYRGARLAGAREWADSHHEDLSRLEQDFLTHSQDAEHAQQQAARLRERRRTRVLQASVLGLLIIAAIITSLAIVAQKRSSEADRQRTAAQRQAAAATSLALTSSVARLLGTRPDVSLGLSLAAVEAEPNADARNGAITALLAARDPGVVGILHGHTDSVSSVAFSPDGHTVASGGQDTTIRLWDVRTNRQIGVPLVGHTEEVTVLAFSSTAPILASAANQDSTVRLWDTRTHRQIGPPLVRNYQVFAPPTFSPDGRLLALASFPGLQLWDVAARRRLASLPGRGVSAVAFSRDGRTVSAVAAKTLTRWDVRSRHRIGVSEIAQGSIDSSAAFDHDRRQFAYATQQGAIRILKTPSAGQRGAPLASRGFLSEQAFSADDRTLAGATAKGLALWDVPQRRPLALLRGHHGGVLGVATSPDGHTIATAGGDATVRLWDPRRRNADELASLVPPRHFIDVASFDSRASEVAIVDKHALLFEDARSGTALASPLRVATSRFGPPCAPARSADTGTLAICTDDGIELVDLTTHRRAGLIRIKARPAAAALASDGHTLAAASGFATGQVRLFDTRTRKLLAPPLKSGHLYIQGVAFSPDAKTLAIASNDRTIRLWNVRTRKRIGKPFRGHTAFVDSVTFSRDGKTLASTSYDRTIRLWNVRTHRQIGTALTGHTHIVRSATFSPDGQTLASTSDDGTVRLWDVQTHTPLGTLRGDRTNSLVAVAFRPDGRTLVTADSAGTIKVWRGLLWRTTSELQDEVCRLIGSGLSRSEWQQEARGIDYRQTCP